MFYMYLYITGTTIIITQNVNIPVTTLIVNLLTLAQKNCIGVWAFGVNVRSNFILIRHFDWPY